MKTLDTFRWHIAKITLRTTEVYDRGGIGTKHPAACEKSIDKRESMKAIRRGASFPELYSNFAADDTIHASNVLSLRSYLRLCCFPSPRLAYQRYS